MKARLKSASPGNAKPKKVKRSTEIDLKDIWPLERDFMARPDRYKYVRKIVRPTGCVFCAALKQGLSAESLVLYKDKLVMVMLNKYPYNNGHLLVLPVRHCGNLLELSEAEYDALQRMVRVALASIVECYGIAGANLGLNHGAVSGAGLPDHAHWHVVPRWLGDTNFFPVIAETKVLAETLEQSYLKLKPYFEGKK